MTGTSAEALHLAGVSKHYGRGASALRALDGIDLRVPAGELFGLIGHNGAGKSTLFKLVLDLIRPSAGQIRVHGTLVGGRDFRAARRSIGYLPENLVLYDNLSALETLQFFARLKGADTAQCPALLDQVGLGAVGRRAVREFSKGMRQRLGFAQALLGTPRLLLLDEPTTGLDPGAIRDFYAALAGLRAQGVTVVISSHILAELQQRVDTLAILGNGTLLASGSVGSLREQSRMPLTLRVTGAVQRLDALAQALTPLPAVQVLRAGAQLLEARVPRSAKMVALAAVGSAGVDDVEILEPSLEDVYFGLREAA